MKREDEVKIVDSAWKSAKIGVTIRAIVVVIAFQYAGFIIAHGGVMPLLFWFAFTALGSKALFDFIPPAIDREFLIRAKKMLARKTTPR